MSKETPGENHMMIWLFSVSFEYSFEVNDDIISFKHEFYDPFNIENKTRKIKKKPFYYIKWLTRLSYN